MVRDSTLWSWISLNKRTSPGGGDAPSSGGSCHSNAYLDDKPGSHGGQILLQSQFEIFINLIWNQERQKKELLHFLGRGGGNSRDGIQAKTPAQECIWLVKGLSKEECLPGPRNLEISYKTLKATCPLQKLDVTVSFPCGLKIKSPRLLRISTLPKRERGFKKKKNKQQF